jgi:hypothetical protein
MKDVATMDNGAEQYDLITVLWRLDGFKGIEGQGHSIDKRVAATDIGQMGRQMGRLRKLLASLQRWVAQLRRSTIT